MDLARQNRAHRQNDGPVFYPLATSPGYPAIGRANKQINQA